MTHVVTRASLLADAHRAVERITAIFDDVAQWNRTHPGEEPIRPDPDGALARGLEQALAIIRHFDGRPA
jgi:hypothetical protein